MLYAIKSLHVTVLSFNWSYICLIVEKYLENLIIIDILEIRRN